MSFHVLFIYLFILLFLQCFSTPNYSPGYMPGLGCGLGVGGGGCSFVGMATGPKMTYSGPEMMYSGPKSDVRRVEIVQQLRSAWVTHLGTSLIFCMVVDISQTKNYSRENPKFSVAILDFGGHLGFWHSQIKICLSWEPLSLKYHVIPLWIGFRGWEI